MPVLLVVGGCGGKERVDVSPVRGSVVYNGQGVPNATVIFFPLDVADETARKMRPFAYADAQGRFEVKTYVTGDGAAPGKYRVSIVATSGPPPSGSKERRADEPLAAVPGVTVPPAVVAKYANVDTAGIEVEIQEGENNLEPFELKM
jgi:hypothetical protein